MSSSGIFLHRACDYAAACQKWLALSRVKANWNGSCVMRILICVPVYNSSHFISDTIQSIGNAAAETDCGIHVHLQDGGVDDSCNKSIEILSESFFFNSVSVSEAACYGIHSSKRIVTKTRIPDHGLYDALIKAFSTFRLRNYDWVTWIGSDDTFASDAFSRLNIIDAQQKEVCLVLSAAGVKDQEGSLIQSGVRPLSREIIASGCADGKILPCVQQEGAFLRSDLLRRALQDSPFDGYQYAGDWNLWRIVTKYTDPHYLKGAPIAFFHKRTGQKSSDGKAYYTEISNAQDRHYAYNKAVALIESPGTSRVKVIEIVDVDSECRAQIKEWDNNYTRDTLKVRSEYNHQTYRSLLNAKCGFGSDLVTRNGQVVVVNKYWQTPAHTERHAWHKIDELGLSLNKTIYLGFPWATLIDKLNNIQHIDYRDKCLSDLVDAFNYLRSPACNTLAGTESSLRVTVCQHILLKRFVWIFKSLQITDIFWTHKVADEDSIEGIRIHAFPLYPVNVLPRGTSKAHELRKYMFTFIGCRSNQWYLTNTRNMIFDHHLSHPDALITPRDQWHFNEEVYKKQLLENDFGHSSLDAKLGLQDLGSNTRDYICSLYESRFSLCPSGSGPNSIRLWESLESDCVPVVLADTYDPPGDFRIWQKACVILDESESTIKNMDVHLKPINEEQWISFRQSMNQLTQDYGKSTFVTDIIKLLLNYETSGLPFISTYSWKRRPSAYLSLSKDCEESLLASRIVSKGIFPSTELVKPLSTLDSLLEGGRALRSNSPRVIYNLCNQNANKLDASALQMNTIRYILAGKHSNRTPLSYSMLHSINKGNGLEEVFSLQNADVIISGFNIDLPSMSFHASQEQANVPVVIISEEPLWDLTWSGFEQLSDLKNNTHVSDGCIYNHLGYFNTDIFDFKSVPYFLLTDSNYISRYLLRYKSILDLDSRQLLKHWESLANSVAFMHEFRDSHKYDLTHPQDDIYGLSGFRCEVAKKVAVTNRFINGKGWKEQNQTRQSQVDWHLDKLTLLDSRYLIVSALENVHFRSYITEKVFDAYACRSVPLYYASPNHYIHRLLPNGSFINLFGLTSSDAAERISEFRPTLEFAEIYLRDLQFLYERFSDISGIARECSMVSSRLRSYLESVI